MSDPLFHQAAARDSLSNFAASLNTGKDKAAHDHFFIYDLTRGQIEAMYRGDWLARKVVDIVPYDMVREWREWSGARADVAAIEREERRLNLRKVLQRALTQGRLYGGAAIVIGTGDENAAELARELDPDSIGVGGLKFLHAISRWQLNAPAIDRDPLSPYFGEGLSYEVVAPTRGALQLHPSRVIRFLGNEWPDPSVGASVWSDSVLQTLYDAIHAVALTTAGAASLMHEAKVDVVTVPNLSEHLSSAATTAQLSARFSYAAAMKSINNLLLLGDGETWSRQKIDFAGLPEMVRTFLQVAAGAADIPVTRLLGQSPAGLSATGDSDTRNYYDMIAARQRVDLRPQLERLDRMLLRSAGVDPSAVSFAFRPLWQMDAAAKATIALNRAQATQIYAGLNLWPAAVTARLVESQLIEDGTYPGAAAIFADDGGGGTPSEALGSTFRRFSTDFDPNQARDPQGRWTGGGGGTASSESGVNLATDPPYSVTGAQSQAPVSHPSSAPVQAKNPSGLGAILNWLNPIGTASAQEVEPGEIGPEQIGREETGREGSENRRLSGRLIEPDAQSRVNRYYEAYNALVDIDPKNTELDMINPTDYIPSEADIFRMKSALEAAEDKIECRVGTSSSGMIPKIEPKSIEEIVKSITNEEKNPKLKEIDEIARIDAAAEAASIKRVRDFVLPNGNLIGRPGSKPTIREMPGGIVEARKAFDYLSAGGTLVPFDKGNMVRLPGNAGVIVLRPITSSPGSPAVDINILGMPFTKLHY